LLSSYRFFCALLAAIFRCLPAPAQITLFWPTLQRTHAKFTSFGELFAIEQTEPSDPGITITKAAESNKNQHDRSFRAAFHEKSELHSSA
jgi:hypothetical protein